VAGRGKSVLTVSLGGEGESHFFGHNGAGKSTTLQLIAGLRKPWSGTLLLDGEDIVRRDIAENVKLGISLVPQGRAFFDDLSVEENLKMAGYTFRNSSLIKERMHGVCHFSPGCTETFSICGDA
jgi:branched-chain amino acid transport system ATP-binding protein